MKAEKDYIQDIAEIRSMMERSSKFLSLSGLAGILAGAYALAGAYIAYQYFGFNPTEISAEYPDGLDNIIYLGLAVFIIAICTATFLSNREATKSGEKLWNATSKRLLTYMAIPFISGAVLILIMLSKGLTGMIAPLSLIFYGLALYNAGKFTYDEVRVLGLVEICLGLIASYFIEFGLVIWALGFGVAHVIYGVYMYYRYKK